MGVSKLAPKLFLAAAGAVGTCCVLKILYARTYKPKQPKGYKKQQPLSDQSSNPPRSPSTDCTRDAFREKKIPTDLDYVVIGTGMGSLYCAALLAKAGKKCLLIEQHYVAGGCTHSFEDHGYEFDTGLHYVGRMEKYKMLLDLVSTNVKVDWAKMGCEEDGYCYDEIKLGDDKPYKIRAGEEAFVSDLIEEFPDEAEAVREYVRLCKRVNKKADMYFYGKLFSPWIQYLLNKLVNKEYFEFASKSTWDVVCQLTSNKRLRGILCGQFGDYGLKPQDSSFLIQAGITAHYLGGAFYPIGGSQMISKALIPTIEAAGGRVLVSCRVKTIDVDGR